MLLIRAARRPSVVGGEAPRHWTVIVPSRGEGVHVRGTLESIAVAAAAAPDCEVRSVLLLDGTDPEANAVAAEVGAEVVVKLPSGPTKGAALKWFAANSAPSTDAFLILDVGSRVERDFFRALRWPDDAAAVQVILRGACHGGIGAAAARSESMAQGGEDRGREALGWSVRLRGTGTALRPAAFRLAVQRLVTQVEDLEMSLVLAADGQRCRLACGEAFVSDDKPDDVASAGAQRARWLFGRLELLLRRSGDFVRLIVRSPVEGAAFLAEIFGRPLTLTALLRGGAALLVGLEAAESNHPLLWISFALFLTMTVVSDLVLHFRSLSAFGAVVPLAATWLRALVLAPRAVVRWMRAKRS